jgi:hypothetical protein
MEWTGRDLMLEKSLRDFPHLENSADAYVPSVLEKCLMAFSGSLELD